MVFLDLECFDLAGKADNCTILSAIEAPSGLWENSIIPDNPIRQGLSSQISPVKMVGLLRPSTIIEETVSQSMFSNIGTVTGGLDSSMSSVYKTAQESGNSSFRSDRIAIEENFAYNVDEENEMNEDFEETVIEINSDEDEKAEIDIIEEFSEETSSLKINEQKELLDDEENKENQSYHELSVASAALEESLNFNDTLEEMDYLLQKGMEYMANSAKKATGTSSFTNTLGRTPKDTKLHSAIPLHQSAKKYTPLMSPKLAMNRDEVTSTELKANKSPVFKQPLTNSAKKYQIEMRPCKKFEFNIPKSGSSKAQYSHIISPVGAYMKNTGSTPLMTNMKINSNKKNDFNIVRKELEHDLISAGTSDFTSHADQNTSLIPLPKSYSLRKVLPKKAYISSNFKHVSIKKFTRFISKDYFCR